MSAAVAGDGLRRVLICEDSKTYAAALARLLSRDGDIEVVGICGSAEEAIERLAKLPFKPDLVTMDLELPGMSGGAAIEQIMSAAPVPILVLSGAAPSGSERALESLGAGALEVLSKDALDLSDPDGDDARALRSRIRLLSGVHVVRHVRAGVNRHLQPANGDARGTASVIGVCASAGGPPAIAAVLAELPASFAIPVLVVQHISSGFTENFASWLDDQVPMPVRLAQPGPILPGVWVAPEGVHLLLDEQRRLVLDDRAGDERHRPSGDVLLTSIAASVGREGVAVVLTGMGSDGADGLGAIRRRGGLTIAQDEDSSAVFGMPRVAAERGASLALAPAAIGQRLRALRLTGAAP